MQLMESIALKLNVTVFICQVLLLFYRLMLSRFWFIFHHHFSVFVNHHFSVFVNYQIAVGNTKRLWTKLQVTRDDDGLTNAGSLVRYHTQKYQTATGYWMDNLEPGHYTFEVHYKSTSSSSISMSTSLDYQTAILQVMWFAGVHAVSDGVKCYPTPSPINKYGVLSPNKNIEVNLLVPDHRVIIAGYQLSIYSSSYRWFAARMHMNNQQLTSTIMTQGNDYYYSLNSLWMEARSDGEYEFGVSYVNSYDTYFVDCQDNYQGNKNLYAMYLPPTCHIITTLQPTNPLSLSSTSWNATDLSYSFTTDQDWHIIVRYQYSAKGSHRYTITRLAIDSVPIKHTASITGYDYYSGHSKMWQGVLSGGRHTIAVEHRSDHTYTHYAGSERYYYTTRAMDIIHCGSEFDIYFSSGRL